MNGTVCLMKPLVPAIFAAFAVALIGCDAVNSEAPTSVTGFWTGSTDYTPAGGAPIRLHLELQLQQDLDSLTGEGILEVQNTSFSDGSYWLTVAGAQRDSVVRVRFNRVILQVLSGYDGRWSADSMSGQITTTLVPRVAPEPIWLNLRRR